MLGKYRQYLSVAFYEFVGLHFKSVSVPAWPCRCNQRGAGFGSFTGIHNAPRADLTNPKCSIIVTYPQDKEILSLRRSNLSEARDHNIPLTSCKCVPPKHRFPITHRDFFWFFEQIACNNHTFLLQH